MGDLIKYISPSSFYYWEQCPLKAVLSKKYKEKHFFPRHPDADLGSIIHKFYEKKIDWNINSQIVFENKWNQLIESLNESYKSNKLQERYCPVQWYSKYYVIKKLLLKRNILSNQVRQNKTSNNITFEKWINNNVVGGVVDLMIFDDKNNIKTIVDFKTGDLYERVDGKLQIKEAYKMQLALYAAVVIDKQGFYPELFIENLKGKRILMELTAKYIDQIFSRAVNLKIKIEEAVRNNNINQLAVVSNANCKFCNYRTICNEYKDKALNIRIDNVIDIKGKITSVNKDGKLCNVEIQTSNISYSIENLFLRDNFELGKEVFIYNLFYPDDVKNRLFTMKSTIIEYGEN